MASSLARTSRGARRRRPASSRRSTGRLLVAVATSAALVGCSAIGTGSDGDPAPSAGPDGTAAADAASGTVVLLTHNSFGLPDELVADFEAETGLTLDVQTAGDGGSLVNQLVLTKDAPLGDVVYGIDNTFASRAIDEGVLEPYESPAAPEAAADLAVGDGSHLTAVDVGDVCINVDHEWFAEAGVPEPTTLTDLTDPAYRDLLVVTNPATSTPGLAFLLATVAAFGEDGWTDYWTALRGNGVKVASGWEDAYYVDFSGPSSEGDRPLVLSYASSPPYEVPEGATQAPTGALLETCFRQVEYAGVLAGAANPEGARLVVDWLVGPDVQAAIPENMYVHPVDPDVALPPSWAEHAPQPAEPFTVESDVIDENRDTWIRTWTDLVIG